MRGSSMLRRSVLSVMVADPSTVLRRWTDDVCYGRDGQIYYASLLSHIFSATAASEGLGNPVARAS